MRSSTRANDGIDFWESLEGQRLSGRRRDRGAGPTQRVRGDRGHQRAAGGAGPRTPRGGILVRQLGQAGDYRPGDFNPERLILDDVLAPTPDVNTGDAFTTDPVGVLDYSFGNFKLLVTADPGRVDNGLAREVTAPGTRHDLSVATFNVENLSPLDADAKVDCPGGADRRQPAITRHHRDRGDPGQHRPDQRRNGRRRPLVAAPDRRDRRGRRAGVRLSPDRPGEQRRWRRPRAATSASASSSAPAATFEFVDRPGGDAATDTDVVRNAARRAADDQPGTRHRRAHRRRRGLRGHSQVAGRASSGYRGETVFVVVNHLSSKGDDRPLFGHFQPPFRLTEFESTDTDGNEDGWRHAQAQAINDFVDEILAVDRNAHVIVLGDINDFDFSETVEIISGERIALDPGPFAPDADGTGQTAGRIGGPIMRTLFDRLPDRERYSYVFDGNSQVLDQILVSNSLLEQRPDVRRGPRQRRVLRPGQRPRPVGDARQAQGRWLGPWPRRAARPSLRGVVDLGVGQRATATRAAIRSRSRVLANRKVASTSSERIASAGTDSETV